MRLTLVSSTILIILTGYLHNFFLRPSSISHIPTQLIISHRGFDLKKNSDVWSGNVPNTIETTNKILHHTQYNGIELDLQKVNNKPYIILNHEPSQESSPQTITNQLSQQLQVPINFPHNEQITKDFSSLTQIPQDKYLFLELKAGGTNPFTLHSIDMVNAIINSPNYSGIAEQSIFISFYWWYPLKARYLSKRKYHKNIPIGINVIDSWASPLGVFLAKVLGYNFILPPHDQVTPQFIMTAKILKLNIISWSRQKNLLQEPQIIYSLKQMYKDSNYNLHHGFIVNQYIPDHI